MQMPRGTVLRTLIHKFTPTVLHTNIKQQNAAAAATTTTTTTTTTTVKLLSADPLTKGHLLSCDTFAWHGLVLNCKSPVIRGCLPITDKQITKFSVRYLASGDSLQAVNQY